MATTTKPSAIRVRLSLPVGLNEKGKETRAYVQQIAGGNPHKVATTSPNGQVNVYDWIIRNAGKPEETVKGGDGTLVKLPAANFEKLGRTDPDETGLYRVKFAVGDGIYRVVRPNIDNRTETGAFKGWPETKFIRVKGGQIEEIDQNTARAAFGLEPVTVGKAKAGRLQDDDSDVSI